MTVATRVVRDALVTAGVTLIDMPAQFGGAALLDSAYSSALGGRGRVVFEKGATVPPEDVG
jgi:hypothetical protein